MPTFNAGEFLKDQGLEFVGIDEASGQARVLDQDGREARFDAASFLKDQGVEADQVVFNTPDQALPSSPLSWNERLKLAFADPGTRLEYLKSKFGEATYDEQKGLVVRNKGAWQEVDPSFFGDGDLRRYLSGALKVAGAISPGMGEGLGTRFMNLAEGAGTMLSEAGKGLAGAARSVVSGEGLSDFAGDLAEFTPDAIRMGLEIAGQARAGAPGAAAGAAIGELAVGEIGRAAGLNKESRAQTALRAAGSALVSGGATALMANSRQAVELVSAAAGRPIPKNPAQVVDNVRTLSRQLDDPATQAFARMSMLLTGRDASTMERLLTRTDRVVGQMDKYLAQARPGLAQGDDAIRIGAQDRLGWMTKILQEASDGLTSLYGRLSQDLYKQAGERGAVVAPDELSRGLIGVYGNAGIGKFTQKGEKLIFEALSEAEKQARQLQGLPTLDLTAKDMAAVKKEVGAILRLLNTDSLKGVQAAKFLVQARKDTSQRIGDLIEAYGEKSQMGSVFSRLRGEAMQVYSAVTHKAGLTEPFEALTNTYASYADPIQAARRALSDPSSVETLVGQFLSQSSKNAAKKGVVDAAIAILGKRGEALHGRFLDSHAAIQFLGENPRFGLIQAAGTAAVGAGMMGIEETGRRVAAGAVGGGILAQSVPRLVAREAKLIADAKRFTSRISDRTASMLGSLSGPARRAFLRNPRAMDAVARAAAQAAEEEAAVFEGLVNQIGAVNE